MDTLADPFLRLNVRGGHMPSLPSLSSLRLPLPFFPLPSPSFPSPLLPFPFPLFLFSLTPLPLEVGPLIAAIESGGVLKLSQWVLTEPDRQAYFGAF